MSRDPCYVCDGVERYTSNVGCVTCAIARGCARYDTHREQISESDRLRYASLSPSGRARLLEKRRAQKINLPSECNERNLLRTKRREWIIRRLFRMAHDDGVYGALKAEYLKQRPKSLLRDWLCRRLMLMARDDGVYDILKARSLEINLEK